MNYFSLYRKYRPATFDDVVEQKHIVRILTNQITSGNVAHAYLFSGTRGTGKTTIARIFARAVNCENPQNGSPCGKCASCIALSGTNSDIYEIDAASNNGVDDVRTLKDSVQYMPLQVKKKVYIIDEVHQFSSSAFNALLKTLEEPPEHCIFILATTEPQKLPQTILSRCLKLDFRLISTEALSRQISDIFTKEGIPFTVDAAAAIAAAGEGSSRDALSVAEACIGNAEGVVDYQTVLNVLGANNPEVIADFCDQLLCGDVPGALAQVEFCCAGGKSVAVLSRDVTKYLRNLLILKNNRGGSDFLHLPLSVHERAVKIAEKYGSFIILRCLEIFSGLDSVMRYSLSPRYVVEMAIARCSAKTQDNEIDARARLENLERTVEHGITVTKYVKEVRICPNEGAISVAELNQNSEGSSANTNSLQGNASDDSELPFENIGLEVQGLPFDDFGQESMDIPFEDNQSSQTPPFEVSEAADSSKNAKADIQTNSPFDNNDTTSAVTDKPSAKIKNKAKAVQYKGYLLTKTREDKLLMLYTIISDDSTLVYLYSTSVDFIVKDKYSLKCLEDAITSLNAYTDEFLGTGYKLHFKLSDAKSSKDAPGLKGMFDPKKVKIIK